MDGTGDHDVKQKNQIQKHKYHVFLSYAESRLEIKTWKSRGSVWEEEEEQQELEQDRVVIEY
jgi:hypothetical protein